MDDFNKKFNNFIIWLENLSKQSSLIAIIGSAVIAVFTILRENKDLLKLVKVIFLKHNIPSVDFNISNLFSLIIVICALIVLSFAILNHYIQSGKESFHTEALKYRETKDELIEQQNYTQVISGHLGPINISGLAIQNVLCATRKLYESENIKMEFKRRLDEVIKKNIFVMLRPIFARNPYELFSVAVYLFNPKTGFLEDYSSEKDPLMRKIDERTGEQKKGRTWEPGDGHIGLAYDRKQIFIHSNIQIQYSPPPKKAAEDDKFWYVSAITVPLFLNEEQRLVRGVFCITSNMEGCFENLTEDSNLQVITSIKRNFIIITAKIIQDLFNNVFSNDITEPFLYTDKPEESPEQEKEVS